MKVILVSSLISKSKNNEIFTKSNQKPLQSVQKFYNMLSAGLVKNEIKVETISSIPMSRNIMKKIFWHEKKEIEDQIEYTYIPFLNIPILRQIFTLFFGFFILVSKLIFEHEEIFVIVDVLNTTVASITNITCKMFGVKCIGIVTDLPRDINSTRISSKINQVFQSHYDGYILLTKNMNEVVNLKDKPFIIIEGFSDVKMYNYDNNLEKKNSKKICIYAGGLFEKYGVLSLIKAFENLDIKNCELHLYGYGDLESYIKNLNSNKIKFFGMLSNDKLLEKEIEATLLINPRFTKNSYTKYSFPSKNIEYMSTGTPVLTTKLEGMPAEYKKHVFLFEGESIEEFTKTLKKVLSFPMQKLHEKGMKAKQFVLSQKNNVYQAEKIKTWLLKEVTTKNNALNKNFNKPNLIMSLFSILVLLISIFLQNVPLAITSLTILFLSNFLYSIINIKKIGILLLFLISFFTFSMGQYYFKNVDDFMYYKYFPNNIVLKTIVIQFISLFCICFVFYIINLLDNRKELKFYKFDKKLSFFSYISLIGFLITMLCATIVNIESIIRVGKYGYLVLYNGQHPSIFPAGIHYLSNSFLLFLIFVLVTSNNKKMIQYCIITYFINLILSLMTGARSEFVIGIFFIFFYIFRSQNYITIFPKEWIKKIIICAIIILPLTIVLLNIYNRTRNKIEIYNVNPITEFASFFVSQGRSINLMNYAIQNEKKLKQEKTNYTFGILYNSFENKVKILSLGNLELPSINKRKSNFAIDISITVLGTEKYNEGNGLGSSYLPELYLDFGIGGVIIFSLLFSLTIGLLNYYANKNYIINALSFLTFNSVLFLTRGQALEFACNLISLAFWLGIFLLNLLYYFKVRYEEGE